MSRQHVSTTRRVLLGALFLSLMPFSAACGEELETIRLNVRVHRLQSETEPRLQCSLSDDEIREQFVAVNETWDQAKIVWQIESIVDSVAQAPDDFTRAMVSPRGQLAMALRKNLSSDNLLEGGFNVAIAEDFEKSIGGVFIPTAGGIVFYAKHGPKGLQTPAVLAHELGHSLGLPHTIFEKGNNLMMGSGPERVPTRVKPITSSQIKIARHYAELGKPFKPPRVNSPNGSASEIFELLDTNGDGSFSAAEAKQEHRLFARDFMRKASRAPSDQITRQQYDLIVRRQRSQGQGARRRQRGYGPEIVPQIYSRFDKDGDGILTRKEANDPSSLVHEYFDNWDRDKNGQLTREEIKESLTESPAIPGALRRQQATED